VEAYLKDNGVPYDVAAAVLPVAWAEPGAALQRARAISELRGNQTFERLVTGVKRVANILPRERRQVGSPWADVRRAFAADGARSFDAARFEDSAETSLLEAVAKGLDRIEAAEKRGEMGGVLKTLSELADPIDHYFDRVLVNASDPAVREARLGFLAEIYRLFGRYADFQAIVEQGPAT
jgi:glycyl-tRNA synthetase beta chain